MSLTEGKFKKAYFEITNVCNASCSFCPKNLRESHFVTDSEFENAISKLEGRAEYLYFHLMGEPLLHPSIDKFAHMAKNKGFKVCLTSNGILSREKGIPLIMQGNIYKISLSLHCFEGNEFSFSLDDYLNFCFDLADSCASTKTVCVFRLWNGGTESKLNEQIIKKIKERFEYDWIKNRSGYKIKEYIFIEFAERFQWPDEDKANDKKIFCYGLRNQIGILSDGTVVPCCLDNEGKIPLGNIYLNSLDEILSNDKAKRIFNSFSQNTPCEELCRGCSYAERFRI